MADVNRGNRPLSPHLSIYRPQLNSAMSIFHRISGLSMILAAILIVWWFLAASTSPEYYAIVDGLINSWIGTAIMVLSVMALWYHFCNGVRHLIWDLGYGMENDEVTQSGYLAFAVALILTIVTLFFA